MSPTRHRPRRRRGAVLVQFALLVAVLLGIAALVSDLGLARVAQGAMQNAADSASVEGLRWTDRATDAVRRERAAAFVRRTFDADGATDGFGQYAGVDDRIGAGPVGQVLAAGGVQGAGGLVPGTFGVHKPDPARNAPNLPHGDLVAGRARPEVLGLFGEPFAVSREGADYGRNDFDPVDASDAAGAPSFLARLRRTPNLSGLDAQPGVSTTGGGVPLLFGLGPLTLPAGDTGLDVRSLGLAVRATAVADARAVVAAAPFSGTLAAAAPELWPSTAFGLPVVDARVDGDVVDGALLPALIAADPSALAAGQGGAWDLAPDGSLALDPASLPAPPFDVELVLVPRAAFALVGAGAGPAPRDGLVRVGDELVGPAGGAVAVEAVTGSTLSLDTPLDPQAGAPLARHPLLVPVLTGAPRRVVGFVCADVYLGPAGEEAALRADLAAAPSAALLGAFLEREPDRLRLELLAPTVVPVNATAADARAWAALGADPALIAAFRALPIHALAPVLVR